MEENLSILNWFCATSNNFYFPEGHTHQVRFLNSSSDFVFLFFFCLSIFFFFFWGKSFNFKLILGDQTSSISLKATSSRFIFLTLTLIFFFPFNFFLGGKSFNFKLILHFSLQFLSLFGHVLLIVISRLIEYFLVYCFTGLHKMLLKDVSFIMTLHWCVGFEVSIT